MYKLNHNSIIRLSDNATIPLDPENRDYAAYLEWVDAGNQPQEIPKKSLDEIKADAITNIRQTAFSLLSQSDWKVTRAFESGIALDKETADYRNGIREASNDLVIKIKNAKTITAVEKIVNSIIW